jgi:hypothetical protein
LGETVADPNRKVSLTRPAPDLSVGKAGVSKNAIIIYTPDQDVDLLADILDFLSGTKRTRVKAVMETVLSYSPMLRFVLTDKEHRLFETWRYCFLGSIDDWITISNPHELPKFTLH